MKIVDLMKNVFQMRTFKDRINVINKSFPNFWMVPCRSYSSTFITCPKMNATLDNLPKSERKALKNLQSDTSIVILPADKGRSNVILNREGYLGKCMNHTNNGPYQLLKKDPTTKTKTKTLKQLKILKDNEFIDNVKDENNNAKNSATFSNYIRNGPIEDDEIMVSFDITSLYTNIPIIDRLTIIKDYVNNDDQFTRKKAIPQDKFLDLIHLVLTTTWYTSNSQFYQQTDGVAMRGPASSTTAEIYMQAYERTAITTPLHHPKVWE